ncbi:MAG: FxsA family protein [Halothiobacillus sp.]
MNPVSFIALLPVIEIVLLIAMGAVFGFWFTVIWIVATAALGIILLRVTRLNVRSMQSMRSGHSLDSADPIGIFATWVGAILLILPGPLTDVIGLILVIPWLRKLTFGLWIAKNIHRVVMRQKTTNRVYEAEVVTPSSSHPSAHRVIDVRQDDSKDQKIS